MYTEIEILGAIGVLGLNRPRTNSLNHAFLQEIYEKICYLDSLYSINVVIVKSLQPFGFSSGLDLGSFFIEESLELSADNIYRGVSIVYKINEKILSSKKIFIAALRGPVIGSSLSIAISCDFRVASQNTWFWLPDPQYGGLLADGGIELLQKLIGTSRAAMILLSNDRIDVELAREWGLFYKVTSEEDFEKTVLSLARRLSNFSELTLGLNKKILNKESIGYFKKEELKEIVNSQSTYTRLGSYFKKEK